MKTYEAIPSRVCPTCGCTYRGHSALSRADNKTLICPDCGIREALDSIGVKSDEAERILVIVKAHYPAQDPD